MSPDRHAPTTLAICQIIDKRCCSEYGDGGSLGPSSSSSSDDTVGDVVELAAVLFVLVDVHKVLNDHEDFAL
ncbi:hypothetical protein SAMD00019534_056020 [Acytostelium subglobosum LB1]|uniref:hypothetical protein n=1 Tax=Acytostelium subglobosum LB1 TaxID=1410327 RepID=UPI00064507A4|nr:hypothetical protein SAMD00019534_056020 [Acytostelium subglobosum LB1]GAM22427.1 hypothetical protein SAMD00019534_056020 [Acytostelium subglobosum LB1]|eukprot:XP_012754547.1 hypothetical protein SAMD00019534_056020 [Acytostelium subglobosum LB1]